MKLWLIRRPDDCGYDEYDSAVVAAETEGMARETSPDEDVWRGGSWSYQIPGGEWVKTTGGGWPAPSHVIVKYLGETDEPAGVICASFNAG